MKYASYREEELFMRLMVMMMMLIDYESYFSGEEADLLKLL